MSTLGIENTFLTLQKSQNEAAMPLLIRALEIPIDAIHDRALQTLVARSNSAGHDLILQRLHNLDSQTLELIRKKGYLSSKSLRDALLGSDRQICENACKVILWVREYGMASTLLNILYGQPCRHEDLIRETFFELIQTLSDGWLLSVQKKKEEETNQAEIQQSLLNSRERVLERLRVGVTDFGIKHRRTEPIEAILLLADFDEPILSKILDNPHHPAFAPMMNLLAKGKAQSATQRLLLSSYRDPQPLKSLLSIAANRSDSDFIDQLIEILRTEMNETVQKNLRQIDSISWIDDIKTVLGSRDEEEQTLMFQYFLGTKLSQDRLFEIIKFFLTQGKVEARRVAAETLSQFSGRHVNQLLMNALNDPDPIVQANVIKTIHRRGIPEAAGQVFKLKNSPYEVVHKAIRDTFNEFSFQRYVRSYEVLDDDAREKLGLLAYEMDPKALDILKSELLSSLRKARSRAMNIVELLSLTEEVEAELIQIVNQKDPVLQSRASQLLAQLLTSKDEPDKELAH